MPQRDPTASALERPDIERILTGFIREELLESQPLEGDPLERGAVDSLGIEQLVEHVQRELGIAIADEEMVRENFESVPALAALVESKLRAGST